MWGVAENKAAASMEELGSDNTQNFEGYIAKTSVRDGKPVTIYDEQKYNNINSEAQALEVEKLMALLARTEMTGNQRFIRDRKEDVAKAIQLYRVMVRIEEHLAGANEQREVANETRHRQYQESTRDKTRPSNYVGMSSPSDS